MLSLGGGGGGGRALVGHLRDLMILWRINGWSKESIDAIKNWLESP